MKKEKYTVTGMTCSACSARVEKAVAHLDGASEVSVNLLTNSMQVSYDETKLDTQHILDAVTQAGYGAFPAQPAGAGLSSATLDGRESAAKAAAGEIRRMKRRLWGSVAFLIPTMYIAMHHMLLEWFGLPVPEWFKALFHGPENAIAFAFSQLIII